QVGFAIPTGALGDYFEPGPGGSVRIAYQLTPTTSVATTLGMDWLRGGSIGNDDLHAPNLQARYIGAEVEHDVVPAGVARVAFRIHAGAGAAQFRSDPFQPASGTATELRQTQPYVSAG